MKYPDITVQLTGEDSNAFSILGRVANAMRQAGVPKDEIDQYLTEAKSGDYAHLLRVTMHWVETA